VARTLRYEPFHEEGSSTRPSWQLDVFRRDGGCVARFANNPMWAKAWPMLQGLPEAGPCRSGSGDVISPYAQRYWSIAHVKDESRMGKRADDDVRHAWTMCPGHTLVGRTWETSAVVREAGRLYIAEANRRAGL